MKPRRFLPFAISSTASLTVKGPSLREIVLKPRKKGEQACNSKIFSWGLSGPEMNLKAHI
jgi:hypothetical protein